MKTNPLWLVLLVLIDSYPLESQTLTNDTPEPVLHLTRQPLELPNEAQLQNRTNSALASEADIRRYLKLTGKLDSLKVLTANIVEQLRKASPDVPEEFWNQFQNETNLNALVELAIPIYQKYFTEEDLKQLIIFNESAVGQKLIAITPQLTKDLMQVGTQWGTKLQQSAEATRNEGTHYGGPPLNDAATAGTATPLNTFPVLQQDKTIRRSLTPDEIAWFKSQGVDPTGVTAQDPPNPPVQTQPVVASVTPPDLRNAYIWMDNFMGMTNASIMADVISMKTQSVKFCFNGQTYDYSGNFTVVLNKPRQHSNPYFGLGAPPIAAFVILENVGGDTMPLQNATIWEKSNGFIDVTAMSKEWIYSGAYTIQK